MPTTPLTAVAVTAIGMTTSLGLDSVDACAAARAGLVRVSEIATVNAAIEPAFAKEDLDGVPPFVGHAVPLVGAGCSGTAKLLALSRPALTELLTHANLSRDELARTGLCVTVSDAYYQMRFAEAIEGLGEAPPPTFAESWAQTLAALPDRLRAAFDLPMPRGAVVIAPHGRVGIAVMVRHAMELMRRGLIDRCIVGGVESCLEPVALRAYAAAGVLKSASNPVGFFPGEAAAYFLVEAEAAGVRIVATALGADADALDDEARPCGRGISDTINEAVGAGGDGRFPALVITDLNGTEGRAADWGYALVHLRSAFGDVDFDLWVPAVSFGETGAAAGAIAVCQAYRATERGYVPGAGALITLASDDGRRAALLLETVRG